MRFALEEKMEETVSTIYHNGQFWIALIEKSDCHGKRCLAEYTFGPEPAAGELFDFYLNKYQHLTFIESERIVRIRKHKKDNAQRISKSHEEYKNIQKHQFEERKKARKFEHQITEADKYQMKKLRKKQKKKGH